MSVGGFDDLDGQTVNGVPGMLARFGERIGAGLGKVVDGSVLGGTRYTVGGAPERTDRWTNREQYGMLRSLADNFNAYGEMSTLMSKYEIGDVAIQGLGNPSNAACAFYEAVLWDGTIREDDDASALPLELPTLDPDSPTLPADEARQEALRRAIHQVWRWSNWNSIKDTAAYECALLGDQLFKVVTDPDGKRAWFEMVMPEQMVEVETDGRGYLVMVRVDTRKTRRVGGAETVYYITRVWDKRLGTESIWEHEIGEDADLDTLGAPDVVIPLAAYGVDFVPLVHWRFQTRSDSERGVSVIMRALDKIIYLDIAKTAMFQRIHRHGAPDFALVKQLLTAQGDIASLGTGTAGTIELGGGKMLDLPQGWDVKSIVAAVDYAAHLKIIQDHYEHLVRTDLPELVWNEVSEAGGTDSGRALDYKLTPAKTRAQKARGRAESELIRITQMCLTFAQNLSAPGFSASEIGTFESGDFDFWIADRPIVPMSRLDDLALEQARANIYNTLATTGSAEGAATIAGYSQEQIDLLARSDFAADLDTAEQSEDTVETLAPNAAQVDNTEDGVSSIV